MKKLLGAAIAGLAFLGASSFFNVKAAGEVVPQAAEEAVPTKFEEVHTKAQFRIHYVEGTNEVKNISIAFGGIIPGNCYDASLEHGVIIVPVKDKRFDDKLINNDEFTSLSKDGYALTFDEKDVHTFENGDKQLAWVISNTTGNYDEQFIAAMYEKNGNDIKITTPITDCLLTVADRYIDKGIAVDVLTNGIKDYTQYTVDPQTLIKGNCAYKNLSESNDYDLYAWAWGFGYRGRFIKVINNKFRTHKNVQDVLFLGVKHNERPGFDEGGVYPDSVLFKSNNLFIYNNNIIKQDDENAKRKITFSIDFLNSNLAKDKTRFEEESTCWAYTWDDSSNAWNQAKKNQDGTYTVDVPGKYTKIIITAGKNEWSTQTNNLTINDNHFLNGVIPYDTYQLKIDYSMINGNIRNDNSAHDYRNPNTSYELRAQLMGNNVDSKDILINPGQNFIDVSNVYNRIVFVFVKEGLGHVSWDGQDGYYGQTIDFKIINGCMVI